MTQLRIATRLVLFVVSTLGLYAFWWVGNLVVPNKVRWRQIVFGAWTNSFVRVSHMRVRTVGDPPQPPFFLVCNHLSYTDIAALRNVVKGVFVAKSEVSGWFLAGPIVRDMGTIFIDRQNRRDIPRAGANIIERLDLGEGVIVFPEGTSTSGEEVLPFNSSFLQFAAVGGVPVSYASISYRAPDGGPPASTHVCWGDDISFFEHLKRLFSLRRYEAVITFGDAPITNPDRKLLARELHDRIEGIFDPVL